MVCREQAVCREHWKTCRCLVPTLITLCSLILSPYTCFQTGHTHMSYEEKLVCKWRALIWEPDRARLHFRAKKLSWWMFRQASVIDYRDEYYSTVCKWAQMVGLVPWPVLSICGPISPRGACTCTLSGNEYKDWEWGYKLAEGIRVGIMWWQVFQCSPQTTLSIWMCAKIC